jgi:hypothetical protein
MNRAQESSNIKLCAGTAAAVDLPRGVLQQRWRIQVPHMPHLILWIIIPFPSSPFPFLLGFGRTLRLRRRPCPSPPTPGLPRGKLTPTTAGRLQVVAAPHSRLLEARIWAPRARAGAATHVAVPALPGAELDLCPCEIWMIIFFWHLVLPLIRFWYGGSLLVSLYVGAASTSILVSAIVYIIHVDARGHWLVISWWW